MKGVVDRYIRRHILHKMAPVKKGFENVAQDIGALQAHVQHLHGHTSQWHSFLHQKSEALERDMQDLRNELKGHSDQAAEKVMARIDTKIQSLHVMADKKDEKYENVSEDVGRLRSHLQQIFAQYNKHIVSLHGRIKELESQSDKDLLTADQIDARISEAVGKAVEKMKEMPRPRPSIGFLEEEKSEDRSHMRHHAEEARPLRQIAYRLTPAQKSLLAILASTDQKLSYRDLAVQYGKSASTVKTILCQLRKQGVQIQEMTSDGVKRFFLDPNFKKVVLSRRL
ncbi:MAG: hypothetical protein ACOCWQ_05780 [Nanoarchaeota archaeon]